LSHRRSIIVGSSLAAALFSLAGPSALAAPAVASTSGDGVPQAGGLRLLIASEDATVLDAAPVLRLETAEAPGAEIADALTCLTQAIYFEARSESVAGQEAVAQVVINRSRLPQYPHSICGVVFDGQARGVGCQFSFACEGAPRGPDEPAAWARAQAVAQRALAGFEYRPARLATHYHASWMTPYWSGRLTRIRQIGGHVFYR
jgi:spore germination cell wall hydrolase CwlJ-like protein